MKPTRSDIPRTHDMFDLENIGIRLQPKWSIHFIWSWRSLLMGFGWRGGARGADLEIVISPIPFFTIYIVRRVKCDVSPCFLDD